MLAVAVAPPQPPARLGGGPDAAERCARAGTLLAPAAGAAMPERDAGDEAWPAQAGGARPLEPGPEWLALDGCGAIAALQAGVSGMLLRCMCQVTCGTSTYSTSDSTQLGDYHMAPWL